MAVDLKDVLPKAHAPDKIAKTPAAGSADEVAKQALANVQEQRWREGTQVLAKPGVNQSDIDHLLDQFGTKRKADGTKDLTTEEQTRHDAAKIPLTTLKKLVDNGYNNIKGTTEGDQVRDAVMAIVNQAYPTGVSVAQRQAIRDAILQDSSLLAHVADRLAQRRTNFDNLGDEVSAARDTEAAAERVRVAKEGEISKIITLQTDRNKLETDFNTKTFTTTSKTEAGELADLEAKTPQITAERNRYENDYEILKDRRKRLSVELEAVKNGSKPTSPRTELEVAADLQKTAEEMDKVSIKWQEQERLLRRKQELIQKRDKLAEEKTTLEADKTKKEQELQDLQAAENTAKQNHLNKKQERAKKENNLKDEVQINKILGEATAEWFKGQDDSLLPAIKQQLEALKTKVEQEAKDKKDTKEAAEKKALIHALETQFTSTRTVERGPLWKRIKVQESYIDSTKVDKFAQILTTDGPEAAMVALLKTQKNPDTNADYSEDEAKAIVGSKDFVTDALREQVTGQIVALKLSKEGGGMTEKDIREMALTTSWGKAAIEKGLERNKDAAKLAEQVTGEKLLSQGFMDKLGKHWWLIVLILTGVLLAGSFAILKPR